jgi:hypothetical protein
MSQCEDDYLKRRSEERVPAQSLKLSLKVTAEDKFFDKTRSEGRTQKSQRFNGILCNLQRKAALLCCNRPSRAFERFPMATIAIRVAEAMPTSRRTACQLSHLNPTSSRQLIRPWPRMPASEAEPGEVAIGEYLNMAPGFVNELVTEFRPSALASGYR